MKKNIIILTILFMFCFSSCIKEEGHETMKEVFFKEYFIDNCTTLEETLTKKYDLNEIQPFFEYSNDNENIGFDSFISHLSFDDVNERFPIEVIRGGGYSYSVYKVQQGGYYYVFWERTFDGKNISEKEEPYVYFSVYLSSSTKAERFDSIIAGNSTAEDVKKIDSSFELSFLMSNGIYSYSYLNPESLLVIKYNIDDDLQSYNNLIVKEKKIISRDTVTSCLGSILSYDLP